MIVTTNEAMVKRPLYSDGTFARSLAMARSARTPSDRGKR